MASLVSSVMQCFVANRQTSILAAPLFLATPAPSTNNGHQRFAYDGHMSPSLMPLAVYSSTAVLVLTGNDERNNITRCMPKTKRVGVNVEKCNSKGGDRLQGLKLLASIKRM